MRRLVDRWIPAFHDKSDKEAGLVHRYYQFLCSIIAGFFVIFASHSAYLGIHKLAIAQCLVIGVILLSTFLYRKTKSVTIGANIILGMTAPITCYRVYLLGGMDSPMLFGWPIISMLALMTLPVGWTLLWTAVHMAFATFFYTSELMGYHFAVQSPESVVSNVRLAMICAVQFILFFSVYLIRRLNTDLRSQARAESEQAMNVVRTLSHDLSSPLMTLKFWLKSIQKKELYPELNPYALIATLDQISSRIAEVRSQEADASGKSGNAPSSNEDPEKPLSQQIFRFTIITVAFVFAGFAASYAYVGAYTVAALQMALAVSCLVGGWIYQKTGSVLMAGNLILFIGAISAFFRAQMLGGINSPAFFIWPLIPLFAATLLPIRVAAAWTALFTAMPIYFDVRARLGASFVSQVSPEASLQIQFVALCVVQAIVLGTTFYLKRQNRSFREQIEHSKQKRIDLLHLLAQEVGEPLRQIRDRLKQMPESNEISQLNRSLKACLEIISHTQAWVNSAHGEAPSEIVDLREVLEEVEFLHHSSLKDKEIKWSVSFSGSGEIPLVQADRVCLAYQIFNNLISNSIKFTAQGGRIAIQVERAQNGQWNLTIEDSGIGIPARILEKLFDSNFPTTRTGTQGEKGTGFGMPIVKMFVERYRGTIHVESRTTDTHPSDHGTRISVSFPAARALESSAA